MPDSDELTGFEAGPGAPMLPPSEIRRRGDRMRRRRTGLVAAGGVLAMAVAIGTPVVALSGPDDPPSTSNTARDIDWLDEIPRSFDVGVLPADATLTFMTDDGPGVDDFTMCGTSVFSASPGRPPVLDAVGATTGLPDGGSTAARTVALYRDDTQAHAALKRLRDGVESCPTDTSWSGGTLVRRLEDASLPADESFVYSQRGVVSDQLSDLLVFQVARVGNALYIGVGGEGPGDQQSVARAVQRLATLSAPLLDSMGSTFSADAVR